MSSRKPAATVTLASILAVGLASTDIPISVQSCPKAGDVATADCRPYLLSFNGTDCVAPADAQCVLIHDDAWGCAFPKSSYTSATDSETIAEYGKAGSGHGGSVEVVDEEGHTLRPRRRIPILLSTTTRLSTSHLRFAATMVPTKT
ncbi:hypothetical protein F441_10906, partial [Phytophthora nicotianae CJ01A1]